MSACFSGPDETDLVDTGVAHETVAHFPTRWHEVEDARRQAGFFEALRDLPCKEWRFRRGFQDDRAASRQRWRDDLA